MQYNYINWIFCFLHKLLIWKQFTGEELEKQNQGQINNRKKSDDGKRKYSSTAHHVLKKKQELETESKTHAN